MEKENLKETKTLKELKKILKKSIVEIKLSSTEDIILGTTSRYLILSKFLARKKEFTKTENQIIIFDIEDQDWKIISIVDIIFIYEIPLPQDTTDD